eukprot:scaffold48_cov311-Pinguiococcus_pyrenoidosus.AAC.92
MSPKTSSRSPYFCLNSSRVFLLSVARNTLISPRALCTWRREAWEGQQGGMEPKRKARHRLTEHPRRPARAPGVLLLSALQSTRRILRWW